MTRKQDKHTKLQLQSIPQKQTFKSEEFKKIVNLETK